MSGRRKGSTKGDIHATAVHEVASIKGTAAHVVGIGNLRVMITRDDGSWFAQALEIDFAAEGTSLPDVKRRFEKGLGATIDEHIRVFGNIEKLLQPAPREAWRELLSVIPGVDRYRFSQVSIHVEKALPFKGITYIEPKAA